MAPARGSVLSDTLRRITAIKLDELEKRRAEFEVTKAQILSTFHSEQDPRERLRLLSSGVTSCLTEILERHPNREFRSRLAPVDFDGVLFDQAKYDPSILPATLRPWEQNCLDNLDRQSAKFEYASLYGELINEWLSTGDATPAKDDVPLNDDQVDVDAIKSQESRQEWERRVFEPAHVDEQALRAYLNDQFELRAEEQTTAAAKAIDRLRTDIAEFEKSMTRESQFSVDTLKWVADGLLASDLLPNEQREVLRDYKTNPTIMAEIADVLNMRMAALGSWSWGEGVPVEQRRKINGTFDYFMRQDLLQALFLQYIGVRWSVFLKMALTALTTTRGAWKRKDARTQVPEDVLQRRTYYLGPDQDLDGGTTLQSVRNQLHREHYFLSGLLDRETQRNGAIEGEDEVEYEEAEYYQLPDPKKKRAACRLRGAPRPPRKDPETDDGGPRQRPMEDKERLVRILSTEITVATRLYGGMTAVHSVFDSWDSALPHETILTILDFFGVSKPWLDFFAKFLAVPLKFTDDGPSAPPRTRRRGAPASCVVSIPPGPALSLDRTPPPRPSADHRLYS
ncbi:hypothetical protein F4780DRAFT_751075 [Xylariomycetidae sp. FL0641]|nr:hypothetical protein F4780DRAFT_751075 [Xylariomycetidae sp. FL0641]